MNRPGDLIRLLRPLDWIKNGFVFTGLLFGKYYHDPSLAWKVILAAAAFCLISSCIYIFNDIIDAESDRHHPKKKDRPIPAGKVTLSAAWTLALLCGAIGFGIAYDVSLKAIGIIFLYVVLNIAYTIRLKHVVILDVFCIAGGFMLRILAGTIGVGIPATKWLLLCGFMITLFLGFAKRRAEIIALAGRREEHRKVLKNYSGIILDEMIGICATGVIITYSLYTMSPETVQIHKTANLIYTVPFVVYALFRYLFLLHHANAGGDPSRDLIKDKHIIASVILWAGLTFSIITYYAK